jgi:hypothetical protein
VISAAELRHSPAWLPLEVDRAGVQLVKLDEAAYRKAAFLDERLLQRGAGRARLDPAAVNAAASGLALRLHYVFHTGHVGSTLLSRLIGEQRDSFFSVREPALLRAAAAPAQTPGAAAHTLSLEVMLALLARTWLPSQRAVVKVTSFVSELAPQLLSMSEGARAIFMYADPQAYLRGILIGPNSRIEARMLAAPRRERLVRRLGAVAWRCDPSSEGEQVAMSWLCEMLALFQAARGRDAQVLWVDFDAFLGAPRTGLRAVFRTLGGEPPPAEIDGLLDGPLMRQYSKAPEYAYDAQLRRELLQSAGEQHGAEISRGMQWLARVANQHPPVRELLEAVEQMRAAVVAGP